MAQDHETLLSDQPLVRLCNAILLSALKKGARRFTLRRTPTFDTVEFELDGVMVDEMHPPRKLFSATVERFALMANIPADSKRGRAQGLIHLLLGRGTDAYYPLLIEGRGDDRVVSFGCFSAADWRAELEERVRQAEAAGPGDRVRLAQALQALGWFATGVDDTACAQRCFERAVECMDHEHTDHDQLGLHLQSLGHVLWQRAEPDEARSVFERAVLERTRGGLDGLVDAAGVGASLEGMADCYWKLAAPERAIEYYQRAIEHYQRGDLDGQIDHGDIARCMNGIGYRLFEQDKLDEAALWFQRAVDAQARGNAHGEIDHGRAGRSLFALADCAWSKGQHLDALGLFEAAAKEMALGAGADHSGVAHCLYWAGRATYALGRFRDAQDLFERAIIEHERGDRDERVDHAEIGWAQGRIAQCRFKLGQATEARAWFERALESIARGDASGTLDPEDLARMRGLRAECLDEP